MSSHFYLKYIKSKKPGFPLKGGPFSRWKLPLSNALYRRRQEAGPEPLRHRSVWSNWNYDSEVFGIFNLNNTCINET